MDEVFCRSEMLLGAEGLERLKKSKIAVFGCGGVGSYCVEALARCGTGRLDIIDNDTVAVSNINRQIIALHSTVGQYKADVAAQRCLDINPEIEVRAVKKFFCAENADEFGLGEYDYIIDAIDTVSSKLTLIEKAKTAGTRIISCMGTGNKLDPTAFRAADISETSYDPLARVIRRELKKRGINGLTVVYSKEQAMTPLPAEEKPSPGRRAIPGSVAFVPAAAGLTIVARVIEDLLNG